MGSDNITSETVHYTDTIFRSALFYYIMRLALTLHVLGWAKTVTHVIVSFKKTNIKTDLQKYGLK